MRKNFFVGDLPEIAIIQVDLITTVDHFGIYS